MKKIDILKGMAIISKEYIKGNYFNAVHHSLNIIYDMNGDSAREDMLRLVDDVHQEGKLSYEEWKELRRIILEKDF